MASTYPRIFAAIVLVSCGGAPVHDPKWTQPEPRLEQHDADARWYRALSTCGQGPYELDAPVTGAKWGEEVELRVHTPRNIALEAIVLADGVQVTKHSGVFTDRDQVSAKPDNARCIADARERLVLARPGGAATGTPRQPGTLVVPPAPPEASEAPVELELVTTERPRSAQVIQFRLPERAAGARLPTIRIKFWSPEPNDLAGVLFGVVRVEWRPTVSEADYVAFLRRKEAERAERERQAQLAWEREAAARPKPTPVKVAKPKPAPVTEIKADPNLRAEIARKEQEERRRAERLLAEARERRRAFCAANPRDHGCQLDQRQADRVQYCAQHQDEARCWDVTEWDYRNNAWAEAARATKRSSKPSGPPPAPRAEDVPPKLSENAEWRPGYWHWIDDTWLWIAGMWRVPDEDIAAERTTTAPQEPPPLKVEAAPPPPIASVVWVAGFWQWNGVGWVWIPGSWQLKPATRVEWRAPEWRRRGSIHVLIPGGWIRIGGR
ncbi:MAG: hypothetical protein AB7O24_14190 [Kofleriaceae bacterium]